MTRPDLPATATRAEFARLAGFKPSYITQLARDGRLVFDEADPKLIRVAESQARILATADPAKAAVAARHAAEREQREPPSAGGAAAGAGQGTEPDEDEEEPAPRNSAYQQSRAKREHFLALQAERDYQQSIGQLVRIEDVKAVVSDAGTTLRNRLEVLPDQLAPQLAAEPDEARCRALMAEAIEHALEETVRALSALGKQSGDIT